MPTSVGPNTFGEENLVFAFDTGDTVNSYKGEPTTNNIVDQRYSFEANRNPNSTTASWSESEQVWYFTLPSGSQNYYRGLRVVNSISSPYAVFEPTGSEIAFSYKIQALSDGLWNFIDYNNRAATGSHSYGNDNRSFTDGPSTIALEKGKIYERKGHYITQANDPLLTGSLYHCYNVICLGPPNAGNTNVDNGGAVSEAKTVKIWDIQHELKDHATQFTTGTRTNTDSLVDLTGNSTIDLTNVSFDSNAQMTFDGTDDQFLLSDPGVGTSFSIEIVIKVNDYSNSPILISPSSVGIDHFFRVNSNGTIKAQFVEIADSSTDSYTSTTVLNNTEYYHVVISKSPSNGAIYVNGVAEDSHTPTLPAAAWSGNWRIGARWNSTYWLDGDLPLLKVYSRTLTASEIKANYNAIKGRFNI